MKKMRCSSLPSWAVVALLSLGCSLFTTPLLGQTWVEIMVSGPWSYVPDYSTSPPYPRIVLVAPPTPGHLPPVIFPGPDVTAAPPPVPASYRPTKGQQRELTIAGFSIANCPPEHASNTGQPYQYPTAVLPTNIATAIPKGYAILLPTPCYFTSMHEDRSQVSISHILGNPQQDAPYTTWMSLHYYVNLSASITATINTTPPTPITFDSGAAFSDLYRPSLSIVIAGDNSMNNYECDSLSQGSEQATANLLGITLYSRFPELLGSGTVTYQTHKYSRACTDSVNGWINSAMSEPAPSKPEAKKKAAGSGDCHMAQTNINNALQ
jgi:hypothetical protein